MTAFLLRILRRVQGKVSDLSVKSDTQTHYFQLSHRLSPLLFQFNANKKNLFFTYFLPLFYFKVPL